MANGERMLVGGWMREVVETMITTRFWILSIMLAMGGLALLKIL